MKITTLLSPSASVTWRSLWTIRVRSDAFDAEGSAGWRTAVSKPAKNVFSEGVCGLMQRIL